jgi:PPM family protein phosphatase
MRRTPRRHSGSFRSFEAQSRGSLRLLVAADAAGASVRGRARQHNEDRFVAQDPVFIVADGVGGAVGGGHAADITVREAARCASQIARVLQLGRVGTDPETTAALLRIPARSQALLRREGAERPELAHMACTLSLALVDWPMAHIISAGDSPCYHFRDGELSQITVDQTLGRQLADAGALTDEQVSSSPLRHVLATAVGAGPADVEPHARRVPLRTGDALILCTDGVSDGVTKSRIADIVRHANSADQACRDILAEAERSAGGDDATAIVIRFPAPATRRTAR